MASYASTPLERRLLAELRHIVGHEHVLTQDAERWTYGYDNSRLHQLPGAVVRPADHAQVEALVGVCYHAGIPLVARGSGTGTAGAAVPPAGAVVLTLERMHRIVHSDPDNRVMVVEPGITNQAVQEAAGKLGFFWPPDPTSAAVCTVGGNLACNAAGPRAVKYGTPRENVLGLRIVTGTGESLRVGTYTTKGVVGYDLTRLVIGSEGTLAIITEATLKLTPLPETKRVLQAVYRDVTTAAAAVSRIMAQPTTPCGLEFMDGKAIEMIRGFAPIDLPAAAGALLMIEVDGARDCIGAAVAAVAAAADGEGCVGTETAADPQEVERLWKTRRALSPALRNVAPKKINEDVVVPVSQMPALVSGLEELSRRHRITIVNFGHAGNGNLHVNLLIDPDDPEQLGRAEHCLEEVFDLVLRLNGTLSGEHGIGQVKRAFVARELTAGSLELMGGIKRVFDPKGILNPGKKLP